jgi:hypothetical protein
LLTEYNNGLGGTNRDGASGAAFLFRNVGLLQALDMWSWWTFSDIFEEGWMRSAPFHNGFGMMTVTGPPRDSDPPGTVLGPQEIFTTVNIYFCKSLWKTRPGPG